MRVDEESGELEKIDASRGKGIRVKELMNYVISVRETVYSIISNLTLGNSKMLEKAINENGGRKFAEEVEVSVLNVLS